MKSNIDSSEGITFLTDKKELKVFMSDDGRACATVKHGQSQRTFAIKSGPFADFLSSTFAMNGLKASQQLKDDIIEELCSMAFANPTTKKVSVRIGSHSDQIVFDLCNDEGHFIVLDKNGYELTKSSPVPFLAPYKQRPMPLPKEINRNDFLVKFKMRFGSTDRSHWLLIIAFILKSWHRDHGSYPILLIEGHQGSGKSTLSKYIKSLVDPAEPAFFSPPKSPDDILIAAFHSYLLIFDNISSLSFEMADHFCRLATGGGLSKRAHYSNDDEKSYVLFRPTIINGISEPSHRPDLQDRMITIDLPTLDQKNRISESELATNFENDLPYLFDGCLRLLSDCLAILPTVQTSNLPRMTEYCRMGIAIEKVLGLSDGEFLRVYNQNSVEKAERMFWEDDLCCAIYKRLIGNSRQSSFNKNREKRPFQGTASELLEDLFPSKPGSGRSPRGVKAFSNHLKRIEPILKTKGIIIERPPRTSEARILIIRFESDPVAKTDVKNLDL